MKIQFSGKTTPKGLAVWTANGRLLLPAHCPAGTHASGRAHATAIQLHFLIFFEFIQLKTEIKSFINPIFKKCIDIHNLKAKLIRIF